MALDVLEWGVIAVFGAVFLIWGPQKIPEVARMIGTARREVDSATKQFQTVTHDLQKEMNIDSITGPVIGPLTPAEVAGATQGSPGALAPPSGPAVSDQGSQATTAPAAAPSSIAPSVEKSADAMLIEMARKLGISTQGKTRDEIQGEIVAMASSPETSPAEATETSPAEATEKPAES